MKNDNGIKIDITPSSEYALTKGETHLYVQLKLQAIEEVLTTDERVPLNLGVVLDRSGSMGGSKIEKAKKAVEYIVENLTKTDIFSLVIYDDRIDTLIPAGKMSEKSTAYNKIRNITARNMTDLHGGMMEGVKQIIKNKNIEYRNVEFLLSDGLANKGITSKSKIALSAKNTNDNEGVVISTFGIGDDFDEDMLVGISDASSGEFYYIESADDIPKFIEKEFKGLLETIASSIQVNLELADNVMLKRILGVSIDEQRHKSLKLGDLRSGNDRLLILDLLVPSSKLDLKKELVSFDLEWIPTQSDVERIEQKYSCHITYTDNEELLSSENQEILDNVAILETALIREEAIQLADRGEFEEAKNLILGQQSVLRSRSSLEGASAELGKLMASNKVILDETLDEQAYDKASRKRFYSMSYLGRKQRKE
jgi:Ca-activated chloride channel family protein